MGDPSDPKRNPFVLPVPDQGVPKQGGCPRCHERDYAGYTSYGMVHFTCRACGNQWAGGIGVEPADPSVPAPPANPRDQPPIEFVQTRESRFPVPQQVKGVDLTPGFRKGIPEGDE